MYEISKRVRTKKEISKWTIIAASLFWRFSWFLASAVGGGLACFGVFRDFRLVRWVDTSLFWRFSRFLASAVGGY